MATPSNAEITIIGDGMTIEGTLTVKGDVRIGGKIIGKVKVDGKTIMSPSGMVEGEIATRTAEIANRVKGDVITQEQLVLKRSAVIEGDIVTPTIVVEEGAQMMGACHVGVSRKPSAG